MRILNNLTGEYEEFIDTPDVDIPTVPVESAPTLEERVEKLEEIISP